MNILNFCPFCNIKLIGKIVQSGKLICNCTYNFEIIINSYNLHPMEINYIFKNTYVRLLCNIKEIHTFYGKDVQLNPIHWDLYDFDNYEKIIEKVNRYIKLKVFS